MAAIKTRVVTTIRLGKAIHAGDGSATTVNGRSETGIGLERIEIVVDADFLEQRR